MPAAPDPLAVRREDEEEDENEQERLDQRADDELAEVLAQHHQVAPDQRPAGRAAAAIAARVGPSDRVGAACCSIDRLGAVAISRAVPCR